MNVKQWALFFVVTLSANYVSATFLPALGGLHGKTRRRDSYRDWNDCNDRIHGWVGSKVKGIKSVFLSKYGRQCSLGDKELDNCKLRNIKAKGFGDFTFGDTCQCYDDNGEILIRFALNFEKIIASFVLWVPGVTEGIFGEIFETVFSIVGHFVNKLLQIVFPSFLCDVVVAGGYDSGFRLSKFNILKPEGNLGFLGGLAGHGDSLGSFSSFIFEPLQIVIELFLNNHFKPILEDEIGNWRCDKSLFGGSGSGRRLGRKSGGLRSWERSVDVESDEGVSDQGEAEEAESDEGEWRQERRTGGSRSGGKWRQRGRTGALRYGGESEGEGSRGEESWERESGDVDSGFGGGYTGEYRGKYGNVGSEEDDD